MCNLGEPVLQAIGKAIAIAGIISHVSTYVTGWNISLQANPQQISFPVAPAPPLTGQFVVSDASSRPWQPELAQCAQAFGVNIPRVLEPDSPIRWDIANNVGIPDGRTLLITPTSPLTGVVPSEGSTRLEYTTGQDTSTDGDLGLGNVTVTVGMSRAELTKLLQLVHDWSMTSWRASSTSPCPCRRWPSPLAPNFRNCYARCSTIWRERSVADRRGCSR